MFRGKTAGTAVALLAAVLLVLPFFAPTDSFAAAHTVRHAEAKALSGARTVPAEPRDESVTARDCDRSGAPAGPFRLRDRCRTADSAPQQPERSPLTRDPARTPTPAPPGATHRRTTRSSTAHSPAALQVFRH